VKLRAEWFWIDRWLASRARELPMEARGIYREMLTMGWARGGQLPIEEERIVRIIGATPEEWARSYRLVEGFWRRQDDVIVNDTQLEVYAHSLARQEVLSERGRKASLVRWRR
jgi:uncharacterized protein YdaU (DUF1376 family)